MPIEIRAITVDEADAFRHSMANVFGVEAQHDDRATERFLSILDHRRTYAAFDGGAIVGTAGAFAFDMAVPGERSVPTGGLTMVTVSPSHRRRGILRRMMEAHFADVMDQGEVLSALWASEAPIYPRFGYGHAVPAFRLDLDLGQARVSSPFELDSVAFSSLDEARTRLPAIYDAARRRRPGTYARTESWWNVRHFEDTRKPGGAPSRRYAVARRDGRDVGYVVIRQNLDWDDRKRPAGTVELVELIATDTRAEASLWSYLVNLDLYTSLRWWNMPVDSALPYLLSNWRDAKRVSCETMWLRLCDVEAALAARTYDVADGLKIRVHHGDRRQTVLLDTGAGTCSATAESPDLEMSLCELSSLYFGTVRPTELARVGRVSGSPKAIERAERLLANTGLAAWCPEIF